MAKRKGPKAAPNRKFIATGGNFSMAAPKESQTGRTRSSAPPLPESSPTSELPLPPSSPRSGDGTKSSSIAAAAKESPIGSTTSSATPFPEVRPDLLAFLPSTLNLEDSASTALPSNKVTSDNSLEVVNSGKTEDLKNAAESEKQKAKDEKTESFQMGASVSSDSPLPLICITRTLKGIPQCPHFLRLRDLTGTVRGLMESAWDQIFIDIANQIQGLKVKNFWVKSFELWEATEDFQSVGYDVIPLRRRLLEVRDRMLEMERTKCEILALKERAEKHRQQIIRLQETIKEKEKWNEKKKTKMAFALKQAVRLENELPKYKALMSKLAKKPLGR